jgi:hypothetical protein
MKKAHASYGQERYDSILLHDWNYIRNRKWDSTAFSKDRGVAGMRNPSSVKCLHAHLAHYWSGCNDNVVGKWVAEEVTKIVYSGKFSSVVF